MLKTPDRGLSTDEFLQGKEILGESLFSLHRLVLRNNENPKLVDQVKRLSVADARYDSALGNECTGLTLSGVLQALKERDTRIVCLRGSPGSGKTPVAKSVARALDSENRLSASFFFDKSAHGGTASLSLFMTTLAAQLGQHNLWYRSAIARILCDTPSILRQSPETQLDSLVIKPFQAIYTHKPESIEESFIVIDGMEEYDTLEDRDELMRLVVRLEGLPAPFRIFMSRRTSPLPKHVSFPSGSDDESGSLWHHHELVSLWDRPNLREAIAVLFGRNTDRVCSVVFSPDGQRIASGYTDGTVRIWDVETGKATLELLQGHTSYIQSISFSPDGSRIISGCDDLTVRLWDAESGDLIGTPLQDYRGGMHPVSFSRDGRRIASGSYNGAVKMWDTAWAVTSTEHLQGPTRWVRTVATSGKSAMNGADGHRDSLMRVLGSSGNLICSISFSPNGDRIVVGCDDGTVQIWDADSGEVIGKPPVGHKARVQASSFSPDGKRIVSASNDLTIRVWDAESGDAICELGQDDDHWSWSTSVTFSPDGKCIAAGLWDNSNTVRVWDAGSGEAIREPLRGHTLGVSSVSFSPDGMHIVSGSEDKTIRV